MTIFSIYIILEDGLCIFNQDLIPNPPPTQLVTGLFTAMQDFVSEVTGSNLKNLTAGGYTFIFEKFGPLTIAISTSSNVGERIKTMFNIRKIGLRFMKKYGTMIDEFQGDTSVFYSFEDDIKEILGEENIIIKDAYPTSPLTPIVLVTLSKDLQATARTLLQLGSGTVETISESSKKTIYETSRDLESLVVIGHVGRFTKDNEIIYFTQENPF
jgi:hypothetical protein